MPHSYGYLSLPLFFLGKECHLKSVRPMLNVINLKSYLVQWFQFFNLLSTKWSYILGMSVSLDAKLAIFQGSPFHLWTAIEFFSFPLVISLFFGNKPSSVSSASTH